MVPEVRSPSGEPALGRPVALHIASCWWVTNVSQVQMVTNLVSYSLLGFWSLGHLLALFHNGKPSWMALELVEWVEPNILF